MKVFADLHHHDLFHSLQMLFEGRLDWDLYRPYGLDWYHEGFWLNYPHIDTAKQYLCDNYDTPINLEGQAVTEDTGIYRVLWPHHQTPLHHNAISLQTFKDTKFDIIIASFLPHLPMYKKLISMYQPQAKYIFQAGNNWGALPVQNLLTSARQCSSSIRDANTVYYHQEFDIEAYYPGPCKNIKSVMNMQHNSPSVNELRKLERLLPEWEFWYHGAGNRDEPIPNLEIAQKLRDVGFVWHVKKADEGYGYNIHYAYATGKPMVVNCSYQARFSAALLYENGVNCIDVCGKTIPEIANQLLRAHDCYEEWTAATYIKFKQVVNFDEEEVQIRKFLERLR